MSLAVWQCNHNILLFCIYKHSLIVSFRRLSCSLFNTRCQASSLLALDRVPDDHRSLLCPLCSLNIHVSFLVSRHSFAFVPLSFFICRLLQLMRIIVFDTFDYLAVQVVSSCVIDSLSFCHSDKGLFALKLIFNICLLPLHLVKNIGSSSLRI